jgi:uncharacterized membrane-anchored protein
MSRKRTGDPVMKRILPAIFIVVCLVQWAIPAIDDPQTGTDPAQRRSLPVFKTAPVDPYDAFRGRYVSLGFDLNSITNEFWLYPRSQK